jgi:polyisoprenoid-binding protein YceI
MSRLRLAGSAAVILGAILAGRAEATEPAEYNLNLAQSRLAFSGTQAGAEFQGLFKKWTAAVVFAPDQLAISKIDVSIDLATVDSQDRDRDQTIRGSDFFDVVHGPTAQYRVQGFVVTAHGYRGDGTLTLRGISKKVPIDFSFAAQAGTAKLAGVANLKRLDFGVGQGEWKATDQVGDDVKVQFSLALVAVIKAAPAVAAAPTKVTVPAKPRARNPKHAKKP